MCLHKGAYSEIGRHVNLECFLKLSYCPADRRVLDVVQVADSKHDSIVLSRLKYQDHCGFRKFLRSPVNSYHIGGIKGFRGVIDLADANEFA